MMDQFETTGMIRWVPAEVGQLSQSIRRSMKEHGQVTGGIFDALGLMSDAFLGEADRIELPGELAILALTLSLDFVADPDRTFTLATLMLLMSETHSDLGGIIFRKGKKICAVLSAEDERGFEVSFNMKLGRI